MSNFLKNLFKGTEQNLNSQVNIQNNSQKKSQEDNTIFGFIFKNLDTFLLVMMFFLIYALFGTFTSYVRDKALFIKGDERLVFAQTLIFGLMGVEVLLSLATSYFRKNSEWAKSILVTIIACVITYFNHTTIVEIFKELAKGNESIETNGVQIKLLLCNWLIFGLGEVISLLMHSKGSQETENPMEVLKTEMQSLKSVLYSNNVIAPQKVVVDAYGNPITAQNQQPSYPIQNPIGFKQSDNINAEANKVKYSGKFAPETIERILYYKKKGLNQVDICRETGYSKGTVSQVLKNNKY